MTDLHSQSYKSIVVDTKNGKIKGINNGSTYQFLGIRYAMPPVGELRFMPPEIPKAWEDTVNALSYSPIALQVPSSTQEVSFKPQKEDCLSLNIWTTDINRKKPVMVFIHGGAFLIGGTNTPLYNGNNMATEGDVVIVTIQYRLGVLGWLDLSQFGEKYKHSANLGLLDQRAALKWVKENIASFGGDPDNITIFGESAGSISVTCHLLTPYAGDLFHKAIAQSGTFYLNRKKSMAENFTKEFMKMAKANSVEDLRKLNMDQIIQLQKKALKKNMVIADQLFLPVLDGELLPSNPEKYLKENEKTSIPLMTGICHDEAFYWYYQYKIAKRFPKLAVRKILNNAGYNKHQIKNLAAQFQKDPLYPNKKDRYFSVASWVIFKYSQYKFANLYKESNNVWFYDFSWRPSYKNKPLYAFHSSELPYVFGNYYQQLEKYPYGLNKDLMAAMVQTWTSFAKHGNPNNKLIPGWKPLNEKQSEIIFDQNIRTTTIPDLKIREIIETYEKEIKESQHSRH